MNIYIGNLSPRTSEEELRGVFEAFGEVDFTDWNSAEIGLRQTQKGRKLLLQPIEIPR